MVGLRLSTTTIAEIDAWAEANGAGSRSAAIRFLIDRALAKGRK